MNGYLDTEIGPYVKRLITRTMGNPGKQTAEGAPYPYQEKIPNNH